MTEWQVVQGTQDEKPAEFDTSTSKVYVYQHKNVERVTYEDENGVTSEFWQYEERKLTKEEYLLIRNAALENELTKTQLALVELYESTVI